MVIKYDKMFTAIDGSICEPITVLVKSIIPRDRENLVVIRTLEGEYETQEEFNDAAHSQLHRSITLMLPDAHRLAETLNEALAASEEG
ncbi:hypothetical protein ES703_94322 [subsurface metagenome]